MKKLYSLIAIILFTSGSASAQTYLQKRKATVVKASVVRVGPPTTYLKNGLSTREVLMLLGEPESTSSRREGDSSLATYIFTRGEGRVLVAEFLDDVLVSTRTEIRESPVVRADTGGK